MRCKIHPCHVTYSGRLLPSPIIKNPSSALMPRHRTIRITTAAATSPRARLIRAEKCGGGIVPVDDVDRIETEIEEIGKNSRRIRSKIAMINTSLEAVWSVLTDYERLSDFIPGLAVSQLVEKKHSYARLFQIGQQKLAFGINFNAKGIVDCFEKDLETLPFGLRRDIEFKMIEGDFQLFEGKWSIEQYNVERYEDDNPFIAEEFRSTLSYVVDVEPKLWLPVSLVEGRLCKEIKTNLSCIREEAHKRS